MAFAVSPTQTVLWDQIKYTGSPKDFAWVLPVKGNAVLELSNAAWFETLDAATSAQVLSPQYTCLPSSGPGFSCCGGGSSADSGGGGGGGFGQPKPPPVTVTHEGTVGPYETVTLHANVPNALPSWLTMHGYAIDPSIKPVIDAYTSEGFDFIALRLQPGEGVQQMKPVRVVTSGMSLSLPLRMVAAGTGANVAITLFVIGEGRYEAQNFPNAQIDPSTLTWDFGAQSSNYTTVRAALLATNGGLTWNSAFAGQGSLLSPDTSSNGTTPSIQVGGTAYPTVAAAYVQQGVVDGEASTISCLTALASIAGSTEQVDGDCLQSTGSGGTGGGGTGGGGTGGGGTGGAISDAGAACTVPSDKIDASQLACGALDDLAVGLVGLHPADVWLTRLEANLPHTALANDLLLRASPKQASVSNIFQTSNTTGDPCLPAGGTLSFSRYAGLRNRLAIFGVAIGLLFATLGRRRSRPRPVRGAGAPSFARARPRLSHAVSVAGAVIALVCATAREARADEYQDHVGRATTLAQSEQYREALAELQAAYALRQSPALLFEMARVQQQLGDARGAADSYQRFLAADDGSDPAKRAQAEAALAQLRSITGAAPTGAPAPSREEPPPVRYEKKPTRSLMAGGGVLFGLAYGPAMIAGILFATVGGNGCSGYTIGNGSPVWDCPKGNAHIASGLLAVPFLGPFMSAFAYRDASWSIPWALVDGVAQLGGLTMMIWAGKHPRAVPVPTEGFQIVPFVGPGTRGLQAIGHF
jgi:hypothetical protein